MNLSDRNNFSILIGSITFITVFLINWQRNLFITSILRGLIGFFIFAALGYILHLFIFDSIQTKVNSKGKHIDIETKQEEDDLMNEVYHTEEVNSFKPLDFADIELDEDEKINNFLKGVRTFTQDE